MNNKVGVDIRPLQRLARRYWAAEAEVVRAYFRRSRRSARHIRWLKAQAFKEYSAIKPLLAALIKLYPYIDRGEDRHQYEELIEKLADETKHARLIMDLLEDITGKKVTPKDLLWLPEDKKLAKIRARYSKTYAGLLHGSENPTTSDLRRKDEDLERAAITLTEGGGGALYQVCRNINGGKFERKIATVFKLIYRDEMKHKDAGSHALPKLIQNRSDYERASKIIRTVLGQRLRMRNEQLGFPLTKRRMQRMLAHLMLPARTRRSASTHRLRPA
jgi:rubrerythrin